MGDTILLKTVVVEAPMDISDLTDTTVGGVGVFDKLLCTMKAHLQTEYELGRITGVDYANVFLGAYQATLQQSASFLLDKEKQAYELDKLNSDRDLVLAQIKQTDQQTLLIEVQTANAELEASKIAQEIQQLGSAIGYTEAQTHMLTVQTDYEEFKNAYIQPQELAQITQQVANLTKQGLQLTAQTTLTTAQKDGVVYDTTNKAPAELANLVLQGELIEAQSAQQVAETSTRLPVEVSNLTKQGLQLTAQTAMVTEQTATVVAERTNRLPVEISLLTAQAGLANKQVAKITYEIDFQLPQQLALLTAQVSVAQAEIPLKAKELDLAVANIAVQNKQIDMLTAQIAAQAAQSALYTQKVVTEKAQVDNTVVGMDSAIDQQNKLLKAQRDGYQRDAEQKAAKLMIDTWNVRKNSDETTTDANFTNLLADKNVGIAVDAMFDGIGRTAATS